MSYIPKTKIKEIIDNAPAGTTPAGIIAVLRKRGHELEGYKRAEQKTTRMSKVEKPTGVEAMFPTVGTAARVSQMPLFKKQQKEATKSYVGLGEQVSEKLKDPTVPEEQKKRIFKTYQEAAPEIISQHPDFDKTPKDILKEGVKSFEGYFYAQLFARMGALSWAQRGGVMTLAKKLPLSGMKKFVKKYGVSLGKKTVETGIGYLGLKKILQEFGE